MKIFSKTAAAALVAGSIGLAAFAPVAYAQENATTQSPAAKPAPDQKPGFQREGRQMERHFARGQQKAGVMGRGILDLVCSARGAERLEHAFVTISHRVTLTDAQKPAFEALKTTALTAQTDFADTCKAAGDAIRADAKPDPVKALQTRLAVDTARVEALTTVLPKFEDFYKSLTPEQKTALEPARRHEGFNQGQRPGKPGDNQRHHQRGMHPQSTDGQVQPPAPLDAEDDVEG